MPFVWPLASWSKSAALSIVSLFLASLCKELFSLNIYLEAVLIGSAFFLFYFGCGIFVLHIVRWVEIRSALASTFGPFITRFSQR